MEDDLIPLEDAARQIPGATKATLLRQARNGRLVVYRVGKLYATTPADLDAMINACRVVRKDVPPADSSVALEAARKTAQELRDSVRKKR